MTGKGLSTDVRHAMDTVLRSRGYDDYPADPELYTEVLDELTDAVMLCFWTAD